MEAFVKANVKAAGARRAVFWRLLLTGLGRSGTIEAHEHSSPHFSRCVRSERTTATQRHNGLFDRSVSSLLKIAPGSCQTARPFPLLELWGGSVREKVQWLAGSRRIIPNLC